MGFLKKKLILKKKQATYYAIDFPEKINCRKNG